MTGPTHRYTVVIELSGYFTLVSILSLKIPNKSPSDPKFYGIYIMHSSVECSLSLDMRSYTDYTHPNQHLQVSIVPIPLSI